MNIPTARWALASVLAVLVSACASQPKTPSVDIVAITAAADSLNKAFVAAVAARDTVAVAGFYSPDAHLLAPGAPQADSHDAIRALWAGFLQTPGLDFSITSSHPIVTQAGDMVIDVGTYSMKFTNAKGKPLEDVGKYVTVMKKVDGDWKILIDTFNSDKPTPGM